MNAFRINAPVLNVRLHLDDIMNWGMKSLGIPDLWRHSEGEEMAVAILDTGIDRYHFDLRDAIVEEKDFTNSSVGPYDRVGHGTHVAGIIGARKNRYGVIGVAPKVSILNAKVIGDDQSGNALQIAEGIRWAVDNGAHIINMSFGSPNNHVELFNAVEYALAKNVILVAAAGNYNSYYLAPINYPARYQNVISVGSVNQNFLRSNFSIIGEDLDIMAPGEAVYSCYPMNMYAKLSGTSMATPFVSGVVALCLSKHKKYESNTPCNNVFSLIQHLQKTAIDLGEFGKDQFYGYGLINPPKVLSK